MRRTAPGATEVVAEAWASLDGKGFAWAACGDPAIEAVQSVRKFYLCDAAALISWIEKGGWMLVRMPADGVAIGAGEKAA